MAEYDAEQLSAGFRAMTMLAGLVRRGGRPAAVAPTIPLRAGEKQFGWFPVTVDGGERRIAVLTNLRLIAGEEFPLRTISRVRAVAGEWSVMLAVLGRAEPIVLSGPWVPWMSVVICAELYGTACPPGRDPAAELEPVMSGMSGPEPAAELEPVMSGMSGPEPAAELEPVMSGMSGREPAAAVPAPDVGGAAGFDSGGALGPDFGGARGPGFGGVPGSAFGGVPKPRRRPGVVAACPGRRGA